MDFRADRIEDAIGRLDEMTAGLPAHAGPAARPAIERWRSDAAALRFHLRRRKPDGKPLILAVLGGTGTGKSTLVNRILASQVSATSFRRTFTSGAVAVAADQSNLPADWLAIEHVAVAAPELPARGRPGTLIVVALEGDLTRRVTVVDTPDLDGDQPAHHAEADRAFRWAEAVLMLVTPEKYQMTELLPYYRLVARYRLPALFVINKCEQQAVVDDYEKLLKLQLAGIDDAPVYVVPRDDAAYEPPPQRNLNALRAALANVAATGAEVRAEGLRNRTGDLLGRMGDQIIAPLREDRAQIDRLVSTLRAMEAPAPGVDVNPLTQQLQRRMQQRSVLYLMGPQRVIERLRQAPGLLVRLPRVAWDYVMRGEVAPGALNPAADQQGAAAPDFREVLIDQFTVVQSRLDDVLRSNPTVRRWTTEGAPLPPYHAALIDPKDAGQIADEELAELKAWLEQRWNATPRDTRVLESLLKHLPGGKQITRWTEAAPYLLVVAIAAATHHLFGGVDLIVLGGWSVATWLTERLSNEVAARTRQANQRITDRFTRLAHDQIERLCRWLHDQAPTGRTLDQLEKAMNDARELLEPR